MGGGRRGRGRVRRDGTGTVPAEAKRDETCGEMAGVCEGGERKELAVSPARR